MTTLSFNRWFFISLLFLSCPSIFTEEPEQNSQSQIENNKEAFEELMALSREHTKQIGWSAQQIIQTLCNNKEQYSIPNKKAVIITLKKFQDLTQDIDLEIYSKNTREALMQAVIINNGLIHFLSQGLSSKFQDFDINNFLAKLHSKMQKNIPDETIINIIEKNNLAVKTLLDEIGTVGLTWYNLLHRKIKEYNIYSLTKKSVLFGAGLFAAATAYCAINTNADGGLIDKWIGTQPYRKPLTGEWCYKSGIIENGNILIQESSIPLTIFQSVATKVKSLNECGIASMAPLFTISYPAIANYCFGDSYNWIKNKYNDKSTEFEQFLNGSQPNKNITEDGQEKVYFDDLIGCEELKALANQLADFVEHPEYYERSKTETHRGILLYGPPQTGKSNFAKALRTLIQDRVGDSKKIGFIDGKSLIDKQIPIDTIFEYAAYFAPCILFLDEIDLIGTNREKDPTQTGKLLTCMQGIDITSKQVIVIGATNRPEQLDQALKADGRFGKQIFIGYPEYKHRKEFLTSELEKRAITLDEEFIDHIAQATNGCTYNNLRRIITEAIIISANQRRLICEADFEKTVDIEIRKIYFGSRNKSSNNEINIISAYQAGKAVARHLLSTDRDIVKVTIEDVARTIKSQKTGYAVSIGEENKSENDKLATEKNESKVKLGEVFTEAKDNKNDLISDEEIKKECLILLAGNIAQQILLGNTYSNCNKHDRADAMQMIYYAIAQGEKVDDKVRAQALDIKDAYEQELFALLENNKELLTKVMNALAEHKTINRTQWADIIS